MHESPRSNALLLLSLLCATVFALAPLAVCAQGQQQQQQRPRNRASQDRKTTAESKEAADQRRRQALELLRETAERARSLDDLYYRSRIQTLAADALWSFDREQARLIFRRAWEAATAWDKREAEEIERESGAEAAAGFVMDARYEVILKTAARDPALADSFLKEFEKERKERDAPQGQTAARTFWGQLSVEDARRLGFADDLLARGESNSAAQMVAPLISRGVRADIVAFIIRLREQNVAAADRLYTQLLAQARAARDADANTVLLLSSPVISPELLVVVGDGGSLQFRPIPRSRPQATTEATTGATTETRAKAPPISGALRGAFYQTAAELLLRPFASPDPAGQTQQMTALYLAIGRLLPFFEQEAAQYAPELRARAQAMSSEMEQGRRDILASHFDLERVTPEQAGDPLRSVSEQLARAGGEAERDRYRLSLVRLAVRNRLWDRARRAAAEIDKAESRRAALSFVAVSQIADLAHAYADKKETDYESIVKFLSGADVPALAAAWGYAEAALVASRSKDAGADALGLLDEAERHAARAEARTRQRVAAYSIVAGAALRLDAQRAWRLLSEVVRAANAVEDFAGEETSLDIAATEGSVPDDADYFSVMNEAFRLDKIFATMAQLDWTKTLAEARALEGDVPQAFVYIAVARATLDQSK
jgi:hypothetical protein